MTTSILLDGQPATSIQALDRGLHYGDGLFETIAIQHGRPLCWDRHLRRLQRGCQSLQLCPPDEALLQEEVAQLCAGHDRAVLKLLLTRGPGARGYRPNPHPKESRLLLRSEWPSHVLKLRSAGVAVRICAMRLSAQPQLAGIKHLNRLEQVLAQAEWDDPAIAEGLMLNAQGRVVEGTMSNLFWVQANTLYTPALEDCGVAGVIREAILQWAPQVGLKCELGECDPDQLIESNEAFLCNSLIGIWPIRAIADQDLALGPIAQNLLQVLMEKDEIMQE